MADPEHKPGGDDHEDDDDEDVDETGYKAVKDAVLFAVDVSNSMLTPTSSQDPKAKDTDSATLAALKCAYALMQQRIISHPSDMMGILLFGTELSKFRDEDIKSSNSGIPYPHCYLLADLDIPSANDVKHLRQLIEDEDEAAKLFKPSSEGAMMADVLFCANQIFTAKAANFASRRLFLVTDNDDPHRKSKDLRSSAIVRAKDLFDLNVMIELFPISTMGRTFDRSKFYDDLTYSRAQDPEAPAPLAAPTKTSASGDGISLLASLLSSIMSRSPAKRALFSNVPLELGPGFRISVKGYILFKRQEIKRSCYIWMDGETPQIAVGSSVKSAPDSGRTISPEEHKAATVKKGFKFGSEYVYFTPEEITKLRQFEDEERKEKHEPIIRIIGFKSADKIPLWANVRPSTFLYPSEEGYVGSTRTFSALQQSLLEKHKIGLAWFIARRNATPVIAALIAGAEQKDPKTNEQTLPPGIWLCPLPFADDIRPNPELATLIRAPDILKDKMRDVVLNLQLPGAHYDPTRYPNPQLQWHYRILQAMALEEDLPEKADDKTVPRYRQIDKRVGATIIEWGVLLEQQIQEWRAANHTQFQKPLATHKRAPSSSTTSQATTKKVKTEPAQSITDDEMRHNVTSQRVGKLTVAVLKEWLAGHGLPVTGKKGELVDRVEAFFEDRMDVA